MTTVLELGRRVCRMPGATHAELQAGASRRVCVGSGRFPFPYWTNIDSDPDMPADIHATVPPLPFEDDSLDEVWACHFLEHLSREQASEFLAECWRCLAPGGTLGLVVPDTRAIMQVYVHGLPIRAEYPRDVWRDCTDLEEICRLFLFSDVQQSRHLWAWDMETLARAMTGSSFVGLREIDRYLDPRLGTPRWYQCGYVGRKP